MTIRSERTRVPPVTPGVVAAGLADHRGALAGDGTLVDRGDPLDDLAVGRDHLPGLDDDVVAGAELRRGDDLAGVHPEAVEAIGRRVLPGGPQAVGLGLAARLGQRLGEVGEQDGEQQQEGQRRLVDDQAGARRG